MTVNLIVMTLFLSLKEWNPILVLTFHFPFKSDLTKALLLFLLLMYVTTKHCLFAKVLKMMLTSHNFVYKQHMPL